MQKTYVFNNLVEFETSCKRGNINREKKGTFLASFAGKANTIEEIVPLLINHITSENAKCIYGQSYHAMLLKPQHAIINTKFAEDDTIYKLIVEFVPGHNTITNLKYDAEVSPKLDKPKKPKIENKRKTISKPLKEKVWLACNGNSITGKCFCCNKEITVFNAEYGHIISVKNGGKTCLDNIKPICLTCNRGMGVINMLDYKTSIGM